jgi:hypothetical protein
LIAPEPLAIHTTPTTLPAAPTLPDPAIPSPFGASAVPSAVVPVAFAVASASSTTVPNRSCLQCANSTAALAFENSDDAREVLAALRADPHVVAATLYTRAGASFASYPAADAGIKAKAQAEIKNTRSDLPLMMTDQVAGYITYFSGRGRGTLENALVRSGRYEDMIRRILKQEGVPQDLIYLAQAESRLAAAVRFCAKVLTGFPSILAGVFAYGAIVLTTGGYSAFAGAAALSILMLPTIILTAEDAIRMVPSRMREAAIGMGAQVAFGKLRRLILK